MKCVSFMGDEVEITISGARNFSLERDPIAALMAPKSRV